VKRRLAAIVLLAVLAPAAHGADSRRYTPGAFEQIDIGGAADVRLQQGSVDEVVIEGDEQQQKALDLSVRNGVLRIDSTGNWQFWSSKKLQVSITLRQLTRLSISGAATVQAPGPFQAGRLALEISGSGLARFERLHAEHLSFASSGAGDADIAGQAADLRVGISGRGDFRGENLMTRRARVAIAGIGDVKVWALEDLTVSISGVGRVEYWGSPNVRRSASGVATVLDRGPKPAP
jgi:hypothetical protein